MSAKASCVRKAYGCAVGQLWEHHIYWWGRGESWQGKTGAPGMKAMLTAMGATGWELVSVTENPQTGYTLFFKRPTQGTSTDHAPPESVPMATAEHTSDVGATEPGP